MQISKVTYWFVFILCFLCSCTPQKKLLYLQGQLDDIHQIQSQYQYRIQRGDLISMNVFSINEKANNVFSKGDNGRNIMNSDISAYLNSFVVSDSGYLSVPLIGNIYVEGYSLQQVREMIQEKIREFFLDAVVDVKIVSFKISILGEVNKPGVYRVYDARLNIFEAIGLAGDLTVYGKRDILLVRQQSNTQKVFEVDLKDRNILTKEYFYLLPDDIIYVQPHKAKIFGFAKVPISEILSVITTTIVVVSFIIK